MTKNAIFSHINPTHYTSTDIKLTVRPEVTVEVIRRVRERGLRSRQPLTEHRDRVVADTRVVLVEVGHQRRARVTDILLVALERTKVGPIL